MQAPAVWWVSCRDVREKAPRAKEVPPEHDSPIAPGFIVDKQDHLENSEEFSSSIGRLITNPPGFREGLTHPRER